MLATGPEDLRVLVQGLRSDQGLMDTDNIRIRIDRATLLLDLAREFLFLLRFGIGLVLCWVLLAYGVEVQGYLSYHPQFFLLY